MSATEDVITTTLNIFSATTNVILTTEKMTTATLKVISATTNVILATNNWCQPLIKLSKPLQRELGR